MPAWRDSGIQPKLGPLDARAALPAFVAIFHVREWTIVAALVWACAFVALGYLGYSPAAALRAVRAWLAGPEITVRPYDRWRF